MKFISTFIIMFLCSAALTFNLAVVNNLYVSFATYYLFFGLILPGTDLFLIKKMKLREALDFLGLIRSKKKGDLAVGLISGGFVFIFMFLIFFFLKNILLGNNNIVETLNNWGISRGNVILVFIVMIVFNGAVEEIFWRGYVHKRLEGMKNRPLALISPIVLFTCQHIFIIRSFVTDPLPFFLMMLGIGIGGVFWTLIREHFKTSLPTVISHVLITLGYMTVFYIFVLK